MKELQGVVNSRFSKLILSVYLGFLMFSCHEDPAYHTVDLLTETLSITPAHSKSVHIVPGESASAVLLEGRWLKEKNETDGWTWIRCDYPKAAIQLPIHDPSMTRIGIYLSLDQRVPWKLFTISVSLDGEVFYRGTVAKQPELLTLTLPSDKLTIGLNKLEFEFGGVLQSEYDIKQIPDFFYCRVRDLTLGSPEHDSTKNQFAFIGYLSLNQVSRRAAILAGGGVLEVQLPSEYSGPLTFYVGYPENVRTESEIIVEAIREGKVTKLMDQEVTINPNGDWQPLACSLAGGFERIRFTVVGSLAVATPKVRCLPLKNPSDPDIIFVSIDTLRADYLGAYGAAAGRTPFLDTLSKRGYVFYNTFSQTPVTNPSHASILTGTYVHQHNVLSNNMRLSLNAVTCFEELQHRGYRTVGAVGARHMSAAASGFGQGMEVFFGTQKDKKSGEEVIKPLLEECRNRDAGPLALFCHFFDPHQPYETVPGESYFTAEAEYIHPEGLIPSKDFTYEDTLKLMAQYRAEVMEVDRQLSKLFYGYRKARPDAQLLMVVVADHGESLYEHGLYFQHHSGLYDVHVKVPLICYDSQAIWPTGFTNRAVETIDIAPTIVKRIGGNPLTMSTGHQLFSPKNMIFPLRDIHAEAADYAQAVWRGDKKTIFPILENPLIQRNVLFNLETDPLELEDRGQSDSETLHRLMEAAIAWRDKPKESVSESFNLSDEEDRESLKALGYVQ